MSDDDSRYPSEIADRFQVRMPPGLRDRIRASADLHGRSMNAEIVTVLEREYPDPVRHLDGIELWLVGMFRQLPPSEQKAALEQMASKLPELSREDAERTLFPVGMRTIPSVSGGQ